MLTVKTGSASYGGRFVLYDSLNRVTDEVQQSKLINYGYDVFNDHYRNAITYPNQRIIHKELDALNRK